MQPETSNMEQFNDSGVCFPCAVPCKVPVKNIFLSDIHIFVGLNLLE